MRARPIRQSGFTLIELLVVLVIIGVVLTFATLSLNPSGASDRLERQSKRLLALAQTAANQAVLSGHSIGLQLTDHGYRFVSLRQGGWKPITARDTPLHPRRLDRDLYLDRINSGGNTQQQTLTLPVSPIAARNKTNAGGQSLNAPAALFLSSGELLPFTLEMSAKGVDHRFDITGAANGDIKRRRLGR